MNDRLRFVILVLLLGASVLLLWLANNATSDILVH
jgi:hypothetical protein